MTISYPPMLPEDRKHLDVPQMPEPKTRFQKDGIVWELLGMEMQRGLFESPRLTLSFVGVNPVNPVNPV